MKGGKGKQYTPRSAMGTIMEPIDVDSEEKIDDLDARIQIGKLSLVFVYAPWCGHCQHYKPVMDELEKIPNRSVQIARVRDDVYPQTTLGKKVPVDGYPSLMLVKPDNSVTVFQNESGEKSNSIPNYTNKDLMKSIVENAGTPEGLQLMKNATVREEEVENMKPVNGNVGDGVAEPSNLQKNIVEGQQRIINTGKKSMHVAQSGGSLYSFLLQVSQELAPAAVLGVAALYRRGRHTRKGKGRKGRGRKTRGRK
jgi:thiol-disulfide isomerase/thioredoxin